METFLRACHSHHGVNREECRPNNLWKRRASTCRLHSRPTSSPRVLAAPPGSFDFSRPHPRPSIIVASLGAIHTPVSLSMTVSAAIRTNQTFGERPPNGRDQAETPGRSETTAGLKALTSEGTMLYPHRH